MKKSVLSDPNIQNLDKFELRETNGGSWGLFIAGAIAGGFIYDAWKAGVSAYVNGCMNGSIQPMRQYR